MEIDAYDKTKLAKKRTGLGRFAHESASFGKATVGQPLAVYMGDDSRGEYIYKFVSAAGWDAADASASNRMAAGDKYLDSGKLYVAKFATDGTGSWVELSITNALISGYAGYRFADQGDVLINARLAADAVGATKMDRPEWNGVNPVNGEVYFTLTNNSNRRVEPSSSTQTAPDAADPRVYTDMKGTTAQVGNPDGKTMFVNIQHPGETTAQANLADPAKYASQWPSNAGYGAGKRPRSATIVITKNDGGRIGS